MTRREGRRADVESAVNRELEMEGGDNDIQRAKEREKEDRWIDLEGEIKKRRMYCKGKDVG